LNNLSELKEFKKESIEITVEKKNGRIESFNEDKLARSVSRAGTPFLMAKDIARAINNKLKEKAGSHSISYIDIRDHVVEELKSRNQNVIADSYSGYRKNRVTSTSNKYDSKVSSSTKTHAKQFAKDKDNPSGRGSKTGLP
jgi:transcriptional repressor NrdR